MNWNMILKISGCLLSLAGSVMSGMAANAELENMVAKKVKEVTAKNE